MVGLSLPYCRSNIWKLPKKPKKLLFHIIYTFVYFYFGHQRLLIFTTFNLQKKNDYSTCWLAKTNRLKPSNELVKSKLQGRLGNINREKQNIIHNPNI